MREINPSLYYKLIATAATTAFLTVFLSGRLAATVAVVVIGAEGEKPISQNRFSKP